MNPNPTKRIIPSPCGNHGGGENPHVGIDLEPFVDRDECLREAVKVIHDSWFALDDRAEEGARQSMRERIQRYLARYDLTRSRGDS